MKSLEVLILKLLLPLIIIVLLTSCEKEEEGPACAFEGGINVGYKVRYIRGGASSGGLDVCQYATARVINLDYYDSEVQAETGLKIEFDTDIDPNFSGCPEYWLRFHTYEPVVIGKTYESLAWVTFERCNYSNAKGWLKFSVFDTEKQTASGTFEITEFTGTGDTYNLVSQGNFKNIPLAALNF